MASGLYLYQTEMDWPRAKFQFLLHCINLDCQIPSHRNT